MKEMAKVALALFVLLYVVSPVDLCPGPIDDLIVVLLSLAMKKSTGITTYT